MEQALWPSNPFQVFGTTHYMALVATLVGMILMVACVRWANPLLTRSLEFCLAVGLVLQWAVSYWVYSVSGMLTVDNQCPLHLCDINAFLSAAALLTRRRAFYELLYFWAMAGTIQGLITPALTLDYPHPRFFLFFFVHGGIVLVALYGVLGLRIYPRAQTKWVAWLLLNGYALLAGSWNYLSGANYGFLARKPATASLFDALGPWPWYIVAASGVALVLFIILDIPFMPGRRRRE